MIKALVQDKQIEFLKDIGADVSSLNPATAARVSAENLEDTVQVSTVVGTKRLRVTKPLRVVVSQQRRNVIMFVITKCNNQRQNR